MDTNPNVGSAAGARVGPGARPETEVRVETTETEVRAESNGDTERARSMFGLVRELIGETQALGRAEIALARSEMKENVATMRRGATSMGIGAAMIHGGMLTLLASAVLALALVWPIWLAALVVGGAVAIIGAMVAAAGRKNTKPDVLKPKRTLRSLDKDKQMARKESRHAMERWS